MLKKLSVALGIICCLSCQTRIPDLIPPSGPHFQIMSIKFNFSDGTVRQNGRIHWRFDERLTKFIFFTPLNQVGLELNVEGENAILINFAQKIFWHGKFVVLLDRLWGIELELAQLKKLLLEGKISRAELERLGLDARLENNAQTGAPQKVRLQRGQAELTLRISSNGWRPGKIILLNYGERYREADLESVLDDD